VWDCLEQSYTKLNICLVFELRQLEAPYGENKKCVWIEQNRTWRPCCCHSGRQILVAYIKLTSACPVYPRIPTQKNEQNYCVIRRVLKSSLLPWLHHVHANTYIGFANSWCLTKRIFLYSFWCMYIGRHNFYFLFSRIDSQKQEIRLEDVSMYFTLVIENLNFICWMTVIARENISITFMFKYRLRDFHDRLFDKAATGHFIVTTDTMICVPRQITFGSSKKGDGRCV